LNLSKIPITLLKTHENISKDKEKVRLLKDIDKNKNISGENIFNN
jgi:hypothetical protein